MSSVLTRVTSAIATEFGQDIGVLENVTQSIAGTLEGVGRHSVTASINLAEAYAAHIGSDFLAPGVLTLINSRSLTVNSRTGTGSRPDTVYDGFFVGANGQTFAPNTPLNQIPRVRPTNGPSANETIIYINGINTNKTGQAASLQAIANRTGAEVIGIHNATEGMIADLGQCITDKLDKGKNPAVDTLASTIYDEIKAGRSVHLIAHSQGGLITSRALSHVYQRLRLEDGLSKAATEQLLRQVKVETFGAAAGHYPDGPQYVHYINRDDPVPSLFGLGWDLDRFNPTLHAGRGAQVHWFTDFHLNPIASHSFEDVYLPRRVPFGQARQGNFGR